MEHIGQQMKRIILRKRSLLLILLPLSFLILEIAKHSATFTEEVFSKRIFKVISTGISLLTGWLPFSLAEAILLLTPMILLFLLLRYVIRLVRHKEQRFFRLMNGILHILCTASVVFFIYVIGCGVNYYRYPVSFYLDLKIENSSEEELKGLLTELAIRTTKLREELPTENEKGVYELPVSKRELGKMTASAYHRLAEEYSVFFGYCPPPKPVFLSKFMSYTQITGIYTCWTMEANVNIDISPYSIAATMCHELAHLHGFIREDEANYIAYLACMSSTSPDIQYSGLMHALIYTGNALYGKNPEAYYQIFQNYYSEAVIRDLIANNEYWKQFENTKIAEVSEKINDTYLKANHQTDGTQSYGRVVDLLLAEYKKRNSEDNSLNTKKEKD